MMCFKFVGYAVACAPSKSKDREPTYKLSQPAWTVDTHSHSEALPKLEGESSVWRTILETMLISVFMVCEFKFTRTYYSW